MSTLTVIKTNQAACITQPDVYLDSGEAIVVVTALLLAAKVAEYLDKLSPSDAYDRIAGLPTTPYDGWRPTPRAGRTENP